MIKDIQMPKFGQTMEEGEITQWYVAVGDEVKVGDDLCEITSEKITNNLAAYDDGTITELVLEEGETGEIGTVIARIEVT